MSFNEKSLSKVVDDSQTIVFKIGSSLVVDDGGKVRTSWMRTISEDIAVLASDKTVTIVSSGAIALGKAALGLMGQELDLSFKQIAASVGQRLLMQHWQDAFSECCGTITASQLLLGREDFKSAEHRVNILRYYQGLKELRQRHGRVVVPVINENDATDVAEIRFGDNDQLAAHVGELFQANLVVLLSKGIDGLYGRDGNLVMNVQSVDQRIRAFVNRGHVTTHGTGGMTTKLDAAEHVLGYGGKMIITRGETLHPIRQLMQSGCGTLFAPK